MIYCAQCVMQTVQKREREREMDRIYLSPLYLFLVIQFFFGNFSRVFRGWLRFLRLVMRKGGGIAVPGRVGPSASIAPRETCTMLQVA